MEVQLFMVTRQNEWHKTSIFRRLLLQVPTFLMSSENTM
jgi:hypothetical protein